MSFEKNLLKKEHVSSQRDQINHINKECLDQKKVISYLFLEPFFQGHGGYSHTYNLCKYLQEFVIINFFSPSYKKPLPGFFQRLWKIFQTQIHLIRKSQHADLVYIRGHFLSFLVVLWSLLKKKKIIFEVNGPIEDALIHWRNFRFLRPVITFLIFQQIKASDAIIVVTPQLKEYILSNVNYQTKNIHIIPNASDHDIFNSTVSHDKSIAHQYSIFFGSLTKWQGIDSLLQAATCENWPKDMDLVIVGQGPEVSLVKRFCKLHSHIIYLGDQPYEKLPGLIANSFCSIIPKNNLGDRKRTGLSPVKFYESLSCGVPLIVTDLPFMSDLVKKYEFGVVVPLDKPDMIAKALQFLLNNPKEHAEMKKKARGYIVKGNTWRHRAKQTFEIIEKLTSD